MTNCTSSTLAAYTDTWESRHVLHFARRTGFSLTSTELQTALLQGPQNYIQGKLDELDLIPDLPHPFYAENGDLWGLDAWACYEPGDEPDYITLDCTPFYNTFDEHNPNWQGDPAWIHSYAVRTIPAIYDADWVGNMYAHGLKQKMILFWSNHFVIASNDFIQKAVIHEYYKTLEQFAFGNFKSFVKAMGKTIGMLSYLNGKDNTKDNLNENYARELYELFTLGVDNGYTQQDIEETAKAFTGWTFSGRAYPMIPYFDDYLHVTGSKTIFGQTISRSAGEEQFEYEDVIEALFQERADQIAAFICTEIYKFFIGYNVVDSIIDELKTIFLFNNFELKPIIDKLLKSQHFFDDFNMRVKIKSPTDLLLSFAKDMDLDMEMAIDFVYPSINFPITQSIELKTVASEVSYWLNITGREIRWKHVLLCGVSEMGQSLFHPPNVAGWPGDQSWLSATYLTTFWNIFDNYIQLIQNTTPDKLRQFAITVSNNSTDTYIITQSIIDYLIPGGLTNDNVNQECDVYQCFKLIFISGLNNYVQDPNWDLNHFAVPLQTANLLKSIARLPEFQLF